jgi:lipopolysaccharide export system protein LptC
MARWRRRSRLIHLLRRALPAAIAAVLLTLAGWSFVRSLLAHLPDFGAGGAVVRMVNPHYYGKDDAGKNFLIDAKEAERGLLGGPIRMVQPHIRLGGGDARGMEISARQGDFEEGTRLVTLTGDVRVLTDDGTQFRTGKAQIDIRAGTAIGNSPVQGVGPLGQINASSYAIYDHGARMVFTGQVHARLKARRK